MLGVQSVFKFALDAEIFDHDPTRLFLRDKDVVLSLLLDEKTARSAIDALYAAGGSNMVGNPRTCPSHGATFCRYMSWFRLSGNITCSKPFLHAHMKYVIEPHLHFNMIRFRLGCWCLRVNDLKLKSDNILRGERACQLCL